MTPSQKIKYAIIKLDYEWTEEQLPEITKDNIDDIYYDGDFYEAADEIRRSGVETGLPKREYSRHYETEEVAIKTPDGSWVGFTFWHGGGKHGNTEEIEWIKYAYDVNCKEEVQTVIVQKFSKL